MSGDFNSTTTGNVNTTAIPDGLALSGGALFGIILSSGILFLLCCMCSISGGQFLTYYKRKTKQYVTAAYNMEKPPYPVQPGAVPVGPADQDVVAQGDSSMVVAQSGLLATADLSATQKKDHEQISNVGPSDTYVAKTERRNRTDIPSTSGEDSQTVAEIQQTTKRRKNELVPLDPRVQAKSKSCDDPSVLGAKDVGFVSPPLPSIIPTSGGKLPPVANTNL